MFPVLTVVAHVLTVFWLVAGIVGRDMCWRQAGRTHDLAALQTLAKLAGIFDRGFVRPATFVVLLTGLVAAWAQGWPILGFLQGGAENWVLAALLIYLSTVPLIFLIFLPKGRIYRKALEEATATGAVTPALRAAINDPLVGFARAYEVVAIGVLALLMIAKPF
jgi:uncharacterized membrane protein